MSIPYSTARVMYYHNEHITHCNAAAQAAIKAGEHLVKIRAELPRNVSWVRWIAEHLSDISQRTIYAYISCYQRSIEDPVRAASCTSIRELLGMSLAGRPHRVIEHTKIQRTLLFVIGACLAAPDAKQQLRALMHAINGTDPKTSALQPLVADWINALQCTPAIR